MRNYVCVDLKRLEKNYHAVRQAAAPAVIAAVVKADAYGHGAVPVSQALSRCGCAHFCVATVEEGAELRQAGIEGEILVLGSLGRMEDGALATHHLTPVLHSAALLEEWAAYARRLHRRLPCHLEFNTGMNRLGLSLQELPALVERLRACPELEVRGLATHFASAENLASPQTPGQLEQFDAVVEAFREAGMRPTWIHAANSAALAWRSDAAFTMVRPGLALYGYVLPPEGNAPKARFSCEPVMEWRAQILDVRTVRRGEAVGYGATWIAQADVLTAVIAAGYADGWSRSLSNRGAVQIRGVRCPLLGRVSMDSCVADISAVSGTVKAGEEAALIGPGQDAAAVAIMQGSVPYELLCGISRRVARRYVG